MNEPLQLSAFLERFECLGDRCADTCCKGWGMQLTQETVDKYTTEAPELLDVVTSGEAEHIMKRDPVTDYCVKFDAGWCGIHKQYGTAFLGDACHFFPRSTRSIGDVAVMTASLSCPEVTRLALLDNGGFEWVEQAVSRLPFSLKDYKPELLESDKAADIHRALLRSVNDAPTAERALARLYSVAASLERVGVDSWAMAVPFYLTHADGRLPVAEGHPADAFNLLHALVGLVAAAPRSNRPRLDATIAEMAAALHVELNRDTIQMDLSDDSAQALQHLEVQWVREWAAHYQPLLKRWIQAQLAIALFPFGGFGAGVSERVAIIGVRFATLKLALMSACQQQGGLPEAETVIRVVQSLSRFLDHLADPTLSMQIYTETGWARESRLRGLIGDY